MNKNSAKYTRFLKVLGRMAPPLPPDMLDKEFSGKEMTEDLDFMLKTMEEVHPDLFFNLSHQKMNTLVREAKHKLLSGGVGREKFFQMVSTIVAKIGDDHTSVTLPVEKYAKNAQTEGSVFPFKVSCKGSRVTVTRSFAADLDGAVINSINGVDCNDILSGLLSTISGMTIANRESLAAVSFRKYLFLMYGYASEFRLVVKKKEKTETLTVPGVTSGFIGRAISAESSLHTSSPYEYKIYKNMGYALLSLRQSVDHSAFSSLIRKMFAEIKEAGVKNLIIDLRGNGGGQSSPGDDLCSYLTEKPFNHFARVDVKVSRQIRKYYSAVCKHLASFPMSLLPARFIHGEPWEKPVGEIVSSSGEFGYPNKSDLHFTGRVLALTDSFTASAASDLAVILKDNEMGKTVGKDTGGFASSYGDSYLFSLPNTFLQCRVSHKFFVRPSGDEAPGPVVPDYPVKTDALKFAVDLITV
ncbi:MAG: hypothetical protein KAH31_06450 [Candidatus Sabulitectum sp.]|nr:hypothetical protein [Candidatus Sabulitectum sp.]